MAAGAFPTQAYGRAVGGYLGLRGTFEGAVRVEQELRIPMEDGVVLLADRYVPRPLVRGRPSSSARHTADAGSTDSSTARRGWSSVPARATHGTRATGSRWRPRPGSSPQTRRSSTVRSTPRQPYCRASSLPRDRRVGDFRLQARNA